ncbi:metallophosphoesterase family protein [Kribbella speibonae]|uniref:metallophosphoesterase family protein n=1 Tax=Kribbella speibonae TaxID=1572660 RepID=UPI001EDFE152|nr:metallophosphoesterase family protein [Kribbella speibonae]
MGLDRIALISDVHGNLTALEAVLADIEGRGIERVFNLGDYAGKGPRGQAVVDRCQEVCEVNILGNWDDFLPDPERVEDSEGLRWWRNELREDQWAWLRGLPFCHDFLLSGRQVRLFHASSADVHHRIVFDHDEKQYASFFENTRRPGTGRCRRSLGTPTFTTRSTRRTAGGRSSTPARSATVSVTRRLGT